MLRWNKWCRGRKMNGWIRGWMERNVDQQSEGSMNEMKKRKT